VERERERRRSARRVARNDATFREANERIRDAATAQGLLTEAIPFLCECAEERCTAVVRLTLDEYQHVRSDSRWFLNAEGHEAAAGPHGRVVEEQGAYVVVEKIGAAGEIVDALEDTPELLPRRGADGG
jgi:hypothetical protein